METKSLAEQFAEDANSVRDWYMENALYNNLREGVVITDLRDAAKNSVWESIKQEEAPCKN